MAPTGRRVAILRAPNPKETPMRLPLALTMIALALRGAYGQPLPAICGPTSDQPCVPGGITLQPSWPEPTLPIDPGIHGTTAGPVIFSTGVASYAPAPPLSPRCAILNESGLPAATWGGTKLPDGSISCAAHTEPPLR